ncbi:flagellar basal-body rod protein FlgF [Methyloversatilis sp. XJ19-49]|uniref:flagellar basal-body rod protein FlgF n=1 Tax=Methyloversatilis sp. XJ19-49 TaxID=2963429 RepID=UPI00211CA8EB|nr:flagellar basal-body rod protein FlgF [Methyloversatilis sp. XJ19-49]MCQ9379239.1 flagellar basal-body rod protein FlgF [Methyloversatilis sp. XJ19-49]
MDRMIYTAMSGAKWTLERQASVAQNLANASSTGYRAEEHRLRAVPVQTEAFASRVFVVDASVKNDFTPGPLQQTGGAYDVAIKGSGWFALAMPDGTEAYTRNGHLQISPTGVLQNHNGIPVQGETGPITVPPDTEVTIGADGTLSAVQRTGGVNQVNQIGRLKLVDPPENTIKRGDDGLFRVTTPGPLPQAQNVRVASGFLEGSNVNVVDQVVAMISLSRQFEMQTRMLTTAERDDQAATQLLSNR